MTVSIAAVNQRYCSPVPAVRVVAASQRSSARARDLAQQATVGPGDPVMPRSCVVVEMQAAHDYPDTVEIAPFVARVATISSYEVSSPLLLD